MQYIGASIPHNLASDLAHRIRHKIEQMEGEIFTAEYFEAQLKLSDRGSKESAKR